MCKCYLLFILEIVYEKINYESILWSSQKGHEYCFSIKKMIKIKNHVKSTNFKRSCLRRRITSHWNVDAHAYYVYTVRVLQNGVIVYFIEKKSNLKLVNTTFNWFSGVDLEVDRYYLVFWCWFRGKVSFRIDSPSVVFKLFLENWYTIVIEGLILFRLSVATKLIKIQETSINKIKW